MKVEPESSEEDVQQHPSQGRRKANADATVKMEQDSSEEEVQQQHRRQARGSSSDDDDDDDDEDEDDDSSSSDGEPESMPSKTKTLISSARADAAARRGNKAQQPDSRQTGDADSFGKRKADDFLRRQELAMDPSFKSTVVLPGDDVTHTTTRTTRSLRLGPGLVQKEEKVLATRAGMLRYRPPCSYWVESNGRRYSARVEDQVMGVVEDRMGESYKVNIFGRYCLLLVVVVMGLVLVFLLLLSVTVVVLLLLVVMVVLSSIFLLVVLLLLSFLFVLATAAILATMVVVVFFGGVWSAGLTAEPARLMALV